MQIDAAAFFNGYRQQWGRFGNSTVLGMEVIGQYMTADPEINDIGWAAYMLATVKHECADKWHPITEFGPRSYFDMYEPGRPKAKNLGNTEVGDGWRYRGRGYVQITGRTNYETMTRVLGLGPTENLIDDPDQALRPSIAYRIMSVGMRKGMFTGKKLSDYITGDRRDYENARRIINGTDEWKKIRDYAEAFEKVLRDSVRK